MDLFKILSFPAQGRLPYKSEKDARQKISNNIRYLHVSFERCGCPLLP